MMRVKKQYTHHGSSAGHPWYYFLGGRVLTPKEIWQSTKDSGYQGYARDDIEKADQMSEPKRSETVRAFQRRFDDELRCDMAIYRQCALKLHRQRDTLYQSTKESGCRSVDTDMSLKTSHLINGFAHLIWLDELLAKQKDLFDF